MENKRNLKQVGNELGTYLLISAVLAVATCIFVCITVKDAPPTPPSYSEWLKRVKWFHNMDKTRPLPRLKKFDEWENDSLPFLHKPEIRETTPNHGTSDYKDLLTDLHFVLILTLSSINFGLESMLMVTANEILIPRFEGYEKKVGLMVSSGLIASIFSNIFIGKLLDQTRAFKRITVATTGLSCLLSAAFSLSFHYGTSFYSLFVTYILLVGVFTTYPTVSFEHVVELTYPISEAKSGVLLIWTALICGLFYGESASLILHYIGAEMLLLCITALFILMFVISLFLRDKGPRPSIGNDHFDYKEKLNNNHL